MKTLPDLVDTFAGNPGPAVIIPGDIPLKVSYNDLHGSIQYLQAELASLGINAFSRVSIILPNSFEFVALFLAISCMRAIAVPLNAAFKQEESAIYLGEVNPSAIIVPKGAVCERHGAALAALNRSIIVVECYISEGQITLGYTCKASPGMEAISMLEKAAEQDVALILYTSGSSGRPKAVPLTHRNLLASMTNVRATYKLTSHDRAILIIPIFHVHGLLASTLAPLYSGGSVIIPTRLTPSFWTDFATYQATWYTATPTTHNIILQFPRPTPLPPSLRFIRSGSAPLSPSLHQKLERTFGVPVLDNYAMTEACGQIASNLLPPAVNKPGSIGTATGVEILILDPDGKPLPADTEGEICIRGTSVTSRYLNDEIANAASFTRDRFFRTGDYGRCDGDGYLFLTGRIKEIINKGGEKISPAELDDVIAGHPAVMEAATFPVEDELYGQDVCVAVRIVDGKVLDEAGLRRWIRGRVAAFKVPKKVKSFGFIEAARLSLAKRAGADQMMQIFFMTEIPKTATGKVQRDVLAQRMVGMKRVASKL